MDALSTILLLLCLASYLSYSLLPSPGLFIFFVFVRLCSSHLLLSASTYFVVRALSFLRRLYPASSRNSFVFLRSGFFYSSYFSVAFFAVFPFPIR